MPNDTVSVRVVESAAEFATLSEAWEKLQADSDFGGVFECFDFQYLWWQSYGKQHELRLLVATEGERLVGILPLYIQRAKLLKLPARILRFVGTGGDTFPDDLGPVLARGREEATARALARAALSLRGWDVMLLTDMNPRCPFTRELGEASASQRLLTSQGQSERIAYMDLPATWEAWLGSLHRDRRYRVKNIRKKLHAAGKARFFVWEDAQSLDQGFDRLVALHHKRWSSVGVKTNAFSSPEYLGFHRALMHAFLPRDRLRLYCLELDEQIVAMFYFYKYVDSVYLMQGGFDPEKGNLKPGQVLLGHIVEHAISDRNRVLDFLRGDHRYKDELASGERETVWFKALRPRPGAVLYEARTRHLPRLKAKLRELLSKSESEPRGETESG